jgi:enterochelin esterase-like enzyme
VLPVIRVPHLQHRTFESVAAQTKVSYFVYTPALYDTEPERRFPVLYWLHGTGGGLAGLRPLVTHFDAAIRAGKTPPMLIVFPNGLANSMWCDSKDGKVPMETILVKELLPHVDATFRTSATRTGRLIEGFSMGGYGAARLGFKYHALFGAVSILAGGPLDLEFKGPRASANPAERAEILKTVFGGELKQFQAQSPWVLAEQNAAEVRGRTRVRMATGERDFTFDLNRAFSQRLESQHIPHTFAAVPGVGHDTMALFTALGEEQWAFYRQVFGAAAAAPADQPPAPPGAAPAPRIENFLLNGEQWTCTAGGQPLSGILLRPEGSGPFPAIVLSHGLGGQAQDIARSKGRELVTWGFVCIATDYTHTRRAGAGPSGARGRFADVDFTQAGARPENIRRALACLEILRQQQDVDPRRIATYGHSMGAFVTIALAAAAPDKLAAAAITSGGVLTVPGSTAAAPTTNVAAQVRVPFLILQGALDHTVPPESSAQFQHVLDTNRVPSERHVFEGVGHNVPTERADEVNRLMRAWFTKHKVLVPPVSVRDSGK